MYKARRRVMPNNRSIIITDPNAEIDFVPIEISQELKDATFDPPLNDMAFYSKCDIATDFTDPLNDWTPWAEETTASFETGRFGNGISNGSYRVDVSANPSDWNYFFDFESAYGVGISFWIHPKAHTNKTFVQTYGDFEGAWFIGMGFFNGVLLVGDEVEGSHTNNGLTDIDLASKIPIGNWTHVAWTIGKESDRTGRVYINGIEEYTYSDNGTGGIGTNQIAEILGDTDIATIDDVIFWNTTAIPFDRILKEGFSRDR